VADPSPSIPERRTPERRDRRKQSRSGRRASDPHTNWRRVGWLFATYGIYLSFRSLPASIKKFFMKDETPAPT